jgi:ABC-type Mn2+/Zn2+ transport system permease subunit
MMGFVGIYGWAIFAAVAMSAALSLVGAQLAARDRAMQTLCVGQGATLGVLLGLGSLMMAGAPDAIIHIGPLLTALIFSVVTYVLSNRVTKAHQSSKNSFFCGIFSVLLALGYLICALFPPLENHMTQVFFGDLATLSDKESMVAISFGLATTLFFAYNWRAISYQSFQLTVFGKSFKDYHPRLLKEFDLLTIMVLSFSVQYLGFLFTIAALFLPTVLGKLSRNKHLAYHLVSCGVLATVSSLIGFILSLYFSRLPTVPTIIIVMCVNSTLLNYLAPSRR